MALLRTVIGRKYFSVEPWDYVWQQSILTHPLCAPIWLAGLWLELVAHGAANVSLGI